MKNNSRVILLKNTELRKKWKPQKIQAKICQVFALENNNKKNYSEHVKMMFSYHSAYYFFSGVSAWELTLPAPLTNTLFPSCLVYKMFDDNVYGSFLLG